MDLETVMASGYDLVVDEDFSANELAASWWIPHYLPHWAGHARSRANHRLIDGQLALFIADDQPAWVPDVEPTMRVSSLQTAHYSGHLGSPMGHHRTDDRLVVVEQHPNQRLLDRSVRRRSPSDPPLSADHDSGGGSGMITSAES